MWWQTSGKEVNPHGAAFFVLFLLMGFTFVFERFGFAAAAVCLPSPSIPTPSGFVGGKPALLNINRLSLIPELNELRGDRCSYGEIEKIDLVALARMSVLDAVELGPDNRQPKSMLLVVLTVSGAIGDDIVTEEIAVPTDVPKSQGIMLEHTFELPRGVFADTTASNFDVGFGIKGRGVTFCALLVIVWLVPAAPDSSPSLQLGIARIMDPSGVSIAVRVAGMLDSAVVDP